MSQITQIPQPSVEELKTNHLQSKLSPQEQKLAAKVIDYLVPLKELAIEAGLPKNIQNRVKQITGKISFMDFLEQIGANKEFISLCLLSDILAKPQDRVAELKLLASFHGLPQPSQINVQGDINVQNNSLTLIKNLIQDFEHANKQLDSDEDSGVIEAV